MQEAYIYDAVRTPRGRGKKDGSLYGIKAVSLLSTVLDAVRDRNHLDTSLVVDLIIGCVTQVGEQSVETVFTFLDGHGFQLVSQHGRTVFQIVTPQRL